MYITNYCDGGGHVAHVLFRRENFFDFSTDNLDGYLFNNLTFPCLLEVQISIESESITSQRRLTGWLGLNRFLDPTKLNCDTFRHFIFYLKSYLAYGVLGFWGFGVGWVLILD